MYCLLHSPDVSSEALTLPSLHFAMPLSFAEHCTLPRRPLISSKPPTSTPYSCVSGLSWQIFAPFGLDDTPEYCTGKSSNCQPTVTSALVLPRWWNAVAKLSAILSFTSLKLRQWVDREALTNYDWCCRIDSHKLNADYSYTPCRLIGSVPPPHQKWGNEYQSSTGAAEPSQQPSEARFVPTWTPGIVLLTIA